MSWRIGPGPVFVYEWLTTSRRWQPYAMRAGLVWLILIGMAMVHAGIDGSGPERRVSLQDLARFGQNLYEVVVIIELTLILLAAPAATAGAVCLDKARGTLDHMLATDLSNAEIVLGKLFVRLIPVLGLVAATLPILALAALLGGIVPAALFGLFLVAVGCAVVGCALAMVLSVHGRKTHEVLMLTYLILILWLIAPALLEVVERAMSWGPPAVWGVPVEVWIEWSNPYLLAFAPYDWPAGIGVGTFVGFLAGALGISAALTGLAAARIRRVAAHREARPARARRRGTVLPRSTARLLPGPSLDSNPVAWREWHRARPSRMLRVAWGIYSALGLLWIVAGWLSGLLTVPPGVHTALMCLFQVSVGLLLLSVGSAASLAEERARGSLDVLLSTPIPTRAILAGKWWGSFRRVFAVAIWPALLLIVPAVAQRQPMPYLGLLGLVISWGAAVTSLGLALATWVGRPGRAVALCVSLCVVGVIGWPFQVLLLLSGYGGSDYQGFLLLLGDPPIGAFAMALTVFDGGDAIAGGGTLDDLVVGVIPWIGIYFGATVLLNRLTHATFDTCLGRIPDSGIRPPRPPGRRSSLSVDELLALVPTPAEEEP